jgi:hypothetical protein
MTDALAPASGDQAAMMLSIGCKARLRSTDDAIIARDGEQGADAERHRLDEQPKKAARCGQLAAGELGIDHVRQRDPAMGQLTFHHRARHAETLHGRAVRRCGLLAVVRRGHRRRGDLHLLLGRLLVEIRQRHEENHRENRQNADPEVQHEGDEQEDRGPRQVEDRGNGRRCHGGTDIVEIAHRLARGAGIGGHHLLEDARSHESVNPLARPDHQAIAYHVECRQGHQSHRECEGDKQQGRLARGRNDAIVDLQHVERRREIEDVDQQAEHRRSNEVPAAIGQRIRQDARKLDPSKLQATAPDARRRGVRSRTIDCMNSPTATAAPAWPNR